MNSDEYDMEDNGGAGFLGMVLIMLGILWGYSHHKLEGIPHFVHQLPARIRQVPAHFKPHPVIAHIKDL